jgi:hypothetical protein
MNPQQPTVPDVTGNKIESDDIACDIRFFAEANAFAEKTLKQIPELQAVAIIPLWAPALENVPTGVLRLRDETQPYLAGLIQMLGRLTAFSVDVHRDMVNQMKAFDRMAVNLVTELRTNAAALQNIKQQLDEQQTQQGAK